MTHANHAGELLAIVEDEEENVKEDALVLRTQLDLAQSHAAAALRHVKPDTIARRRVGNASMVNVMVQSLLAGDCVKGRNVLAARKSQ